MRIFSLLIFISLICNIAWADNETYSIRVAIEDIQDKRTLSGFYDGLKIELNILSDLNDKVKAICFKLIKAEDDLGNNLLSQSNLGELWSEVSKKHKDKLTKSLELENPLRKAMYVKKLIGELELFVPERDPEATIVIDDFSKNIGKIIKFANLKHKEIQVSFLTKKEYDTLRTKQKEELEQDKSLEVIGKAFSEMFSGFFESFTSINENSVIMKVKDDESKVVSIEFVDPNGETLSSITSMRMGDIRVYDFGKKLSQGTIVKLHLLTEASIVKTKISLKDIALP